MRVTAPLLLRGTAIDAARRFLLQHHHHPDWGRFKDALTPEQRSLLEGEVRKRSWYEVGDYMGLLDQAGRHLAPDSPETLMTALGRFVMDDGVTTLYRAFFAIVSPSFVIRLSALFWFQFYKGSRLKVVDKGKNWVHGAIFDAAVCSLPLCHSIKGGMISALEHAGARGVKVEQHTCRSTGAERCDFRFSWQR